MWLMALDRPHASGSVLRLSRERAGMSRSELAALVGVSTERIGRWEDLVETLDRDVFLAAYRLTLPPTPPGWDSGHAHDASLPRGGRPPQSVMSPGQRRYWERIDRWLAEVDRGDWFAHRHAPAPARGR